MLRRQSLVKYNVAGLAGFYGAHRRVTHLAVGNTRVLKTTSRALFTLADPESPTTLLTRPLEGKTQKKKGGPARDVGDGCNG